MKTIAVAQTWAIYEVPEDTFELLPTGITTQPPQIVLEVMVMNGLAKKVATVGTMTLTAGESDEDEGDDDDMPDGGSPFEEDLGWDES